MARTPGALNKPKTNEEGLDFDNTTIEGVEVKPKKEGRGRPSGGKIPVEKAIIADKLNTMCEGVAYLLGYEYQFSEQDYNKESIALSNIAKIYPPVAKVLEFFDPLLIVFGIFSKFKSMKKKNKKQPDQKEQNVSRETIQPQNQQPSGLTLMKMGQ